MFEHLVSNVKGHLETNRRGNEVLSLTWVSKAMSSDECGDFLHEEVGALSTWLKQDHPPTAAQIAARLVERWDRNTDLAEASWGEKLADLARQIEAAILAAERAREAT